MSVESEIERIVERVLSRMFVVTETSYTSYALPLSMRTKKAFARICKTIPGARQDGVRGPWRVSKEEWHRARDRRPTIRPEPTANQGPSDEELAKRALEAMGARTRRGIRTEATAAPLRQWVLTVPHPWRKRLAYDGELLGALTRIFVSTVLGFYKARLKKDGAANGQSGAVVVVQRTSSDLKTNPHLHVIFLDGVYREFGDEAVFRELPRLSTREVGEVLERAVDRMTRHVRRRELRGEADGSRPGDDAETEDAAGLAASAVDGRSPPAGPEWRRKRGPMPPLVPQALAFDKPLCASLDGFTLHAATRAGALDAAGREALCKYVLRPAVAQERVTQGPDGLVRIALKKPFSDGTVAVDMDPLSLLCRLAAAVPPESPS